MSPAKRLEIEARIAQFAQTHDLAKTPAAEAYRLLYPEQVSEHYFTGVWQHVLAGIARCAPPSVIISHEMIDPIPVLTSALPEQGPAVPAAAD